MPTCLFMVKIIFPLVLTSFSRLWDGCKCFPLRPSVNVGPWIAYFAILVPLRLQQSESGSEGKFLQPAHSLRHPAISYFLFPMHYPSYFLREISTICWHKSSYPIPIACASCGKREVSVMPGRVFPSRQ